MVCKIVKVSALLFLIVNLYSNLNIIEGSERSINKHEDKNKMNNDDISQNYVVSKRRGMRLNGGVGSSMSSLLNLATTELLSRGKNAVQSSEYQLTSHPAKNAVDGNKNTDLIKGRSCSHTKESTDYPWWRVDLGEPSTIERVEITNRQDCCSHRMYKYNVMVTDKIYADPLTIPQTARCGPEGPNGDTRKDIVLKCDQPLYGQYVTIYLNAKAAVLQLCEVEVFGYKGKPTTTTTTTKATTTTTTTKATTTTTTTKATTTTTTTKATTTTTKATTTTNEVPHDDVAHTQNKGLAVTINL